MTAWDEYLAAAQRLDLVRRATAAVMAERTAAQHTAREELAGIHSRIQLQQARLLDAARQAGANAPALVPGNGELTAARAALGPPDNPQAVHASLVEARISLDSADAVLSGVADAAASPPSPARRNSLVYGGYALLTAVLQMLGFLYADEASGTGLLVLVCGLVLPFIVFALGWLTVGAFPSAPGGTKTSRTPVLGAALSLLSLLPMLAVVIWIVVRALGR